jgi:prepilin-type N-terminal cleavage/methylation domain-containing protein
MSSPVRRRRRPVASSAGFTLVELLVVIAIIGVLVALLLPAVQAARESSRRAQCQNQLKQWSLAAMNHEAAFQKFPYGNKADVLDSYTWMHLCLPYIEQQALYEQFQNIGGPITQSGDWPGAHAFNSTAPYPAARRTVLAFQQCPSDRKHVLNEAGNTYYSRARGNYRACAGSGDLYAANLPTGAPTGYLSGLGVYGVKQGQIFGGSTPPLQCTIAQISDGTSNTIAFSEGLKDCIDVWSTINDVSLGNMGGTFFSTFNTPNSSVADRIWGPCPRNQGDSGYPASAPCTSLGGPNRPSGSHNNNQRSAHAAARSRHPSGVNASLADGSTRFISNSINAATYRALGTKDLGETLGDF